MDFTTLIDDSKAAKNGHSVQSRTDGLNLFDTPGAYSTYIFPIAQAADAIPAWSIYPTLGDTFLRDFYRKEEKLSGAVYSMTSFAKTLDLKVDGLPRSKKYAQNILNDCENGRGYRQLVATSMLDWNTLDNGMFWELIGAGRADRPLRGALLPPYIMHLDSLLCWRTFDEEFPVVYRNPITGQYHKLHYTRVVYRSCMEQSDELGRGIGLSPVRRVLRLAQMMRDILIYRHEKVSGKFTRAIGYGTGINPKALVDTLRAAEEASESAGFAVYKGLPFFLKNQGDVKLDLLDLASLGDGFDLEKETTLYMYILSLAFGVDAREFWPASQSGATKADASIQDMKTQGKGKGDVIETLSGLWRDVFPDSVEAVYDYTDDEQDYQRAQINQIHVNNFTNLASKGIVDVDEARLHLVKEGALDPALLKAQSPQTAEAEPVSDATPEQDEENAQGKPNTAQGGDKPTEESEPIANDNARQQTKKPTATSKALESSMQFEALELKKKELQSTRLDFEGAFDNVLSGAKSGDYTRAQAQRLLYRLIQRYGTQAYIDGLADGGVEITDSSELERDDLRTINGMLNTQSGYVNDFMGTVFDGDVSDTVLEGKATQWFNGSIFPFYTAGLTASGANPMMEFSGDDGKESCPDCVRLKEQRHRLKDWIDRGFDPPNGINLDCHDGHNCHHQLVRVRGRERGGW